VAAGAEEGVEDAIDLGLERIDLTAGIEANDCHFGTSSVG
jgi:hypothetical protein